VDLRLRSTCQAYFFFFDKSNGTSLTGAQALNADLEKLGVAKIAVTEETTFEQFKSAYLAGMSVSN